MNKKGFTLVELLAVLVLLGVIMTLSFNAYMGISASSDEKLLEAKYEEIRHAAIDYGQSNPNVLTETCVVSGQNYSNCKVVTVKELLDNQYLYSEETDSVGNKLFTNNVTKKSMFNDTAQIYRKNNRVYAVIKDKISNN